jgi:hypothetical protein
LDCIKTILEQVWMFGSQGGGGLNVYFRISSHVVVVLVEINFSVYASLEDENVLKPQKKKITTLKLLL